MNQPDVRVIATDLDGTLLRSDGTISDRTLAALTAAEDAGITVVFVTGRPVRWMEDLFGHVGSHGIAILSNGALVWDVAGDKPILERPIAPETLVEACAVLRDAAPGLLFGFERLEGLSVEATFLGKFTGTFAAREGLLEEISGAPALKLLARLHDGDPDDLKQRAIKAAGHLLEITGSTRSPLLEMSARGVTKATTLDTWCRDRGWTRDNVIAFGDMPNDLDMLGWAGTSYAMANAHPTVTAVATHRTASNDEDGVAVVIETLLAGG
ncbi:MAG: Cof-type HAD-IIB family hydrolase [Marmoricola sp.]